MVGERSPGVGTFRCDAYTCNQRCAHMKVYTSYCITKVYILYI